MQKGLHVVLKDATGAGLARGKQQINNNLKEKVKKRSLSSFDKDLVTSQAGVASPPPTLSATTIWPRPTW